MTVTGRADVIMAFVGKQDPFRLGGEPGPILAAVAQLPFSPRAALLLYAEGASDRADNRDERVAEGTQGLRAEEVAGALRSRHPGIEVDVVELRADPSHARALLEEFRTRETIQALRERWRDTATVNVLIAGGTPGMRELLSALHVGQYFSEARGWYAPDRDVIRMELPLVAQSVSLAGVVTAVSLGEYGVALEQLRSVDHPAAESARVLLTVLVDEQDGDTEQAFRRLGTWMAPAALGTWKADAAQALRQFGTADGGLMVLWNASQVSSARNALLAYGTLLEAALRRLLERNGLRDTGQSIEGLVNTLRGRGVGVPEAMDAGSGQPKRLYALRNDVIHAGQRVTSADLPTIYQAATDLIRAYPPRDPEGEAFLRAPHRNAFAPARRPELARAIRTWLTG